jgi:hypothetical protein
VNGRIQIDASLFLNAWIHRFPTLAPTEEGRLPSTDAIYLALDDFLFQRGQRQTEE